MVFLEVVFGGPLFSFFIICIIDVDAGLLEQNFKFAEDIKLGKKANNWKYLWVQNDIDIRAHWSFEWNLSLIPDKCKVKHIGYKNPKAIHKFFC